MGRSGLTTYKELCNMATDLGRPELVYKFMEIANHSRGISATRGAAAGLGRIMKVAGPQLKAHVEQMMPKLYR